MMGKHPFTFKENRTDDNPATTAAHVAVLPSFEGGDADRAGGGIGVPPRGGGGERRELPAAVSSFAAAPPSASASSTAATTSNHSSVVLPFAAHQDILNITYDGEHVWKAGEITDMRADEFDGYFTTVRPSDLINGGNIDVEAFQDMIRNVGGDPESAAYVAALTNVPRPPMGNVRQQTKKALHQYAFGPLSLLFYCFDPSRSTSGGGTREVSTLLGCSTLTTVEEEEDGTTTCAYRDAPFECMPDGALLANERGFVLAMMELSQEDDGVDQDAMFRCALMTSVTAVALVQRNVAHNKVYVPFVVNVGGETAILFVARMDQDMEAPTIWEVRRDPLHDRKRRVEFVATLSALMYQLKHFLVSTPAGENLLCDLTVLPARPRRGRHHHHHRAGSE